MFTQAMPGNIEPNTLIFRLQPNEGIGLSFQVKGPGSGVCLDTVLMDFPYQNIFVHEAYERVLLNCMQGDQMLFAREDGVEASWELLTPLLEKVEREARADMFPNYASGTAGPAKADALLKREGRSWRPL
jgi:glucose-6-phosphate 1-dehydrogenase